MTVAHENDRQCLLWCGNQQIALFAARDGARVPGNAELNHMALKLESGEYEEVRARLEAEGLAVSGRPGDDRCIYFSDPDGHRLQVLTPAEQH
jgi:catechol-2,3-dioxygenase